MINHNKPMFINIDLNLPDHTNELIKAEEIILKFKENFNIIQKEQTISPKLHTDLFEKIIKILDYVGNLSLSAFSKNEELEKLYLKQYHHTPKLAKRLWLDHYKSIHRPYNLLKDRCYRLLDELDEEYILRHKKTPPNWNY